MEAGEQLSLEEEITYFIEILGYNKEEAEKIIYILHNSAPGLFID